jgi:hypothetical protein
MKTILKYLAIGAAIYGIWYALKDTEEGTGWRNWWPNFKSWVGLGPSTPEASLAKAPKGVALPEIVRPPGLGPTVYGGTLYVPPVVVDPPSNTALTDYANNQYTPGDLWSWG